jgi:kynureninase
MNLYPATYSASLAYASSQDSSDPLASLKSEFFFPQHEGNDCIYFCGNSLGLIHHSVGDAIQTELHSWKTLAVGGYFGGANPWLHYHKTCTPTLAALIGAREHEVMVMNALTVNLHLMMLSFYKPSRQRFKIIMEAGAFPSDQYAVETLVKHFGFTPDEAIVELSPRPDEKTLRIEDVLEAIGKEGEATAMVMMGGINYYTGQFFNMEAITQAAHKHGAVAAFDLAHVVGNLPLSLHDWEVDFAVWCSYKYLNAGPGGVGGVFVHEKHCGNTQQPRLGGWWGNDESTRFKMEKGFLPKPEASGWSMSTSQVLNTVALKASLQVFERADIHRLRQKSISLTGYLEYLLHQLERPRFEIITPSNPEERGAQLSLYFPDNGRRVHEFMIASGIVVDYREPGVIRVAPAPLFCSYCDVYRFYEILKNNF